MIEVIIPEDCFIMFSCGFVHCGTPSQLIDKGAHGKNTKAFFTIVEKEFFLTNEITIQKKNLLCNTDSCILCINNNFTTNEDNDPLIDLRNSKKCNAKINDNNTTGKFDIVNGNLNTLRWVILKSSMAMGDTYNEYFSRLNIIESEDNYWQKLVNTDYERIILFPGNYGDSRFDNNDIPFGMLKSKKLSDYDVALKHLNEQYGLSKVEYKLYHPNLLRDDIFINRYQQIHCDF